MDDDVPLNLPSWESLMAEDDDASCPLGQNQPKTLNTVPVVPTPCSKGSITLSKESITLSKASITLSKASETSSEKPMIGAERTQQVSAKADLYKASISLSQKSGVGAEHTQQESANARKESQHHEPADTTDSIQPITHRDTTHLMSNEIFPVWPDHLPLPEMPAVPLPIDCFSWCGQFGVSILTTHLPASLNTSALCRFCVVPDHRRHDLMGPHATSLREAYLYPSLSVAYKQAFRKHGNGWKQFYCLMIHGNQTYRVSMHRFRAKHDGPDFRMRPQINYTFLELKRMSEYAHAHITKNVASNEHKNKHEKRIKAKFALPRCFQPIVSKFPHVWNCQDPKHFVMPETTFSIVAG